MTRDQHEKFEQRKITKKNNYFIASNEHTFTNSSVPPKTTIL